MVTMMKENIGRAARRRVWYNLLAGLCCLVCVLMALLVVLETFSAATTTAGPPSIDHGDGHPPISADKRHSLFRKKWMQMQGQNRGNNNMPTDGTAKEDILNQIIQGKWQLISIMPDMEWLRMHRDGSDGSDLNYEGLLRGVFCPVDWSSHEQDPSATPMFRDVLTASGCDSSRSTHVMDLYQVVQAAKVYDQQRGNENVLKLSGVVFHESRCGSTLLANLMQLHNPNENVVYSESPPPITILSMSREEEPALTANNQALAIELLQHVIYLMSRRPESRPDKRRVFFKIQSAGTPGLGLFRKAFPTTPWVFAYREPVEVMMSHLNQAGANAICVRSQSMPPKGVVNVVSKYSTTRPRDLTYTEYCAAHLASLTEQALHELEQQPSSTGSHPPFLGMAVNYRDLPNIFTQHILPKVWNLTVDEESMERMVAGSTSYSKGRGEKARKEFVQDSQAKQEHASLQLKQAAQIFLQPSYEQLEHLASRAKQELEEQEQQ